MQTYERVMIVRGNTGKLIKHLRQKNGVTQAQLAEKLFISQAMLSNIENDDLQISIIDFRSAFAALGISSADYWVIYLSVEEFESYMQYRKMKAWLGAGNIDELSEGLYAIKRSALAQRPFLSQFLAFVNIIVDEETDAVKLEALYRVLKKSVKNFEDDKIATYRLTYSEALIINEIALTHAALGQHSQAVALLSGMVQNIDNWRTTIEENKLLLPKPHVDLATLLIQDAQYQKAVPVCESALALVKRQMNMRFGPQAAYLLGVCYHKLDNGQCLHMLIMAYHSAMACRQNVLANKIAKEYGIS